MTKVERRVAWYLVAACDVGREDRVEWGHEIRKDEGKEAAATGVLSDVDHERFALCSLHLGNEPSKALDDGGNRGDAVSEITLRRPAGGFVNDCVELFPEITAKADAVPSLEGFAIFHG